VAETKFESHLGDLLLASTRHSLLQAIDALPLECFSAEARLVRTREAIFAANSALDRTERAFIFEARRRLQAAQEFAAKPNRFRDHFP
jgi:hypothetical protein